MSERAPGRALTPESDAERIDPPRPARVLVAVLGVLLALLAAGLVLLGVWLLPAISNL
jgi:predicted lipid-binding transport protein (Tim44 family)